MSDMPRQMSKICCFCCYVLALGGLLMLDVPVRAQSMPDSIKNSLSEVVLLDNGRVLQGQIARTVDQVHVQMDSGSRIILPAKRVVRILDSLVDVWKYRDSELDADDVDGHLSLFHWCLKHQLKQQAQQQLDRLMQTKIDARQLKYLDRQLTRAFEPPKPAVVKVTKVAKNSRKRDSAVVPTDKTLSYLDVAQVFQPLPAVEKKGKLEPNLILDRAIALASHTEATAADAKPEQPVHSSKASTKKSMRSQLESMTDLLTREDLHQFQRRVQPVLLKGCLAAKCHNSTATAMPLLHRGRGQLVPKRFTQRNLHSIVGWIDPSEIVESRLLTQAVTAHGGQKGPAIQIGSKEFKLLSEWLAQVVNNSPELIPIDTDSNKPNTIGLVGLESAKNQGPAADVTDQAVSPSDKPSSGKKSSGKLPEPDVDPFDPTAFNRLPK